MLYKGYNLPGDLILIGNVFWQTLYYKVLIHIKPLPKILHNITVPTANYDKHSILNDKEKQMLSKICKAADFLLIKVLYTEKPCLPRSLVLYRWCCRYNIDACLHVGVKKDNNLLKGHSWLEIEGEPYRENLEHLKEYTVMLEGRN